MELKVKSKTYLTFSVRRALKTKPVEYVEGRGLVYFSSNDPVALDEASRVIEPGIKLIREKLKDPELPVQYHVELVDGVFYVEASVRVEK